MIPIFYRNYPYAPKATFVSAFSYLGGLLSALGAVACIFALRNNFVMILPAIILIALAVLLFVYVGRKYADKLAETETEKNITTKPRYAMLYCQNNPEAYDHLAEVNPEFGQKYMMNEKGKCVKRK